MDFTKFVSLLDSRCLFFSRADKFEDPFEGAWPRKNILVHGQHPLIKETIKSLPRHHAINCWHMNEHESAAMWKLYTKSNEGIAVQSTYKKFRGAIIDIKGVFVGIVKYIDYTTGSIDAQNLLNAFVHKRKSFEHECEARAVVWWPPYLAWLDQIGWKPMDGPMPIPSLSDIDDSNETIDAGLNIKVNIEALIEHIYVAPNSPAWFADLVKAVLKQYKYDNIPVVHSKLDEKPIW